MNDIIEKLRGIDKRELSKAIKEAKAYMKTDEGKALAEKIKSGEAISEQQKSSIAKELGKNPDIAKTIADLLKG